MKWRIPLGLTVLPIGIALLLSPKASFSERYLSLLQWDSQHYQSIAKEGYHLPNGVTRDDVHSSRANLGFFPAYPLITQAFTKETGIETSFSLLLVAQLLCVLFWVFMCKLLAFWKLPVFETCLTLALYPASFFMVAGYSESLFLVSLVALIFFTERWIKETQAGSFSSSFSPSFFLAALAGVFLTGSRLIGFLGVFYPLIRGRGSKQACLLSLLGSLGGVGYFVYCQIGFGSYKLYFDLQQLGWGNQPDYLAVLKPSSYIPLLFFEDTRQSLCRLSNLGIVLLLFRNLKGPWHSPGAALSICAFLGFFVSVSGKASYGMDSVIRYHLPIFLLLILASWVNQRPFFFRGTKLRLFLIVLQLWMLRLFVSGRWVA